MITYQEFRNAKTELLKSNPLRMDCMNTQKALQVCIPTVTHDIPDRTKAHAVLADHFGHTTTFVQHLASGIRELITDLAESHLLKSATFLIPEDVYPVYFELIRGRPILTYKTLPVLDLAMTLSLAPTATVLLLPLPLVPSGTDLSESDLHALIEWLAQDQSHLLIIDSAYAFNRVAAPYETLLNTGQCIQLLSLSKAWLCPNLLGMAVAEASLMKNLDLPKHEVSGHWRNIVCSTPNLPGVLQAHFDREWQSLSTELKAIDFTWSAPKNGYFKILNIDYKTLLKRHNMLGVPASVFGSILADLTVVSCLFETQKTLSKGKI